MFRHKIVHFYFSIVRVPVLSASRNVGHRFHGINPVQYSATVYGSIRIWFRRESTKKSVLQLKQKREGKWKIFRKSETLRS